MEKFKAGDHVYCPALSEYIMTLEITDETKYCLQLKTISHGDVNFNVNGVQEGHRLASIFHATSENKSRLEAIYDVKLEAPQDIINVKLPRTFKPDVYDTYWTIDPFRDNGYSSKVYGGSTCDKIAASHGVWETEEEIIVVVNALKQLQG